MNGYSYAKHRVGVEGWTQWECVKRKEGCKGRLKISRAEDSYEVTAGHSHGENFAETKALLAVGEMKARAAEEPNVSTLHLTQDVLSNADSETLVSLPKEASLKKQVRRIRRQHLGLLPTSIEDLQELPENHRNIDGERFLFYDSATRGHRVLAFASRRVLQHMSTSNMWFGDGTFRSRPLITAQLYVILYDIDGHTFLGCAALMQNRTEQSYGMLFEAIRDHMPEARQEGPARFSTDFELASMNAFTEVFHNTNPSYCFFHFSQSLFRAASATEGNGTELRAQFHALLALPFVPVDHVVPAFTDLRDNCMELLDDVLDLLEDYYVLGRRRGRGRTAPRYPPQTWNVYERTLQGIPRTNNTCEGWNRRWNTLIGKTHPNIYEFIEGLKKEERYADAQRRLVELGEEPPNKKRRQLAYDRNISNLVARFQVTIDAQDVENEDDDPWETGYLKYLRQVGHSARSIFD